MTVLPADTVLLVIDVQEAFNDPVWGKRNNPGAEKNIAALLAAWRKMDSPIIHIHHLNPRPGSLFNGDRPGVRVKDEALPLAGEPVLFKSVNSAFIGTDLEERLRARGASNLVIVGLTTDHCVSTTTRMAGNLGFAAHIVSDATATFGRTSPEGRYWTAEDMHDTALASLNKEFATVVSTAEVLRALEGTGNLAEITVKMNEHEASTPNINIPPTGGEPSPAAQAYIDRITGHLKGRAPLEVLKETVANLERLIDGASATWLAARPEPDKWCVNEILAHLADAEAVLGYRVRQILSQNGTEIAAFDQDRWAEVSQYRTIPATRSMKRLAANREANLDLLTRLSPAQMQMYGMHSERGRETVTHLIRMWAGHDLNHLLQIENVIEIHRKRPDPTDR